MLAVACHSRRFSVGPRITHDRQDFPPNNIIHMLGGAGFLWLGWSGFNGGAPCSANRISSLAILNTHLSTATSLFIWLSLDMIFYKKSSVIGAVQGVMTGLVCITPAAGVVEPWAAMLMGASSGSIPWYTMMVLNKRLFFLQKVDDTLGVFHTHAVAGTLGGLLAGLLAHPRLLRMFYEVNSENHHHPHHGGLAYSIAEHGHRGIILGLRQLGVQVLGAVFVAAWNIVITSIICLVVRRIMPLRMNDEDLMIGDDAVHGEEAYAIWGDGARNSSAFVRRGRTPKLPVFCSRFLYFGA